MLDKPLSWRELMTTLPKSLARRAFSICDWGFRHAGYWLENLSPIIFLRALAPVGILVALILFFVEILDRHESRILSAWRVIAASPAAGGGNIGQRDAVEFLIAADVPLSQVNLSRALLRDANLSGANLERAVLSRAVLERANLSASYLWRANLRGAFLTRANLTNADLSGAFLEGARLEGADLTGANLSQTDLSDADLSGARVTLEQLSSACAEPQHAPKLDQEVRPSLPWPQPCAEWK
jgi:hypothetical protein